MLSKRFLDKLLTSSRFEFLLLVVLPFVFWLFCFRHFFAGQLPLIDDAVSYFDRIGFYTDFLKKGIYPLWDPFWDAGSPFHFFLRRMGDVNPFIIFITFLKGMGMSHIPAYLTFLGIYYFLTMWGFYLIARLIFADRFLSFFAYLLLLFSSWGLQLFSNYIIIIFLPVVWFFYFLLSFAQRQNKANCLGICLSLGIIITTYIPFYFLIIVLIFTFFYACFYLRELNSLIKKVWIFVKGNKVFFALCLTFLVLASIPALVFYKESKSAEFVLPSRHAGAGLSSQMAVGLENVVNGDIVSHGYFEKIFTNHSRFGMQDIFIPHLFFLVLLCAIFSPLNKLILFLFINIFTFLIISVTTGSRLHHFLYEHVVFFQFIRNVYYFFWIAILPLAILFVTASLKSFLYSMDGFGSKKSGSIYIVILHILFAGFLWQQGTREWLMFVCVVLSALFFLNHLWRFRKELGFILIFLSIGLQSYLVYGYSSRNLARQHRTFEYEDRSNFHFPYERKSDIVPEDGPENASNSIKSLQMDTYYASKWFVVLQSNINPKVLNAYMRHKFILYDQVFPYDEGGAAFKQLEDALRNHKNLAFVPIHSLTSADLPKISIASQNPLIINGPCEQLKVVRFDPNSLEIHTHLSSSKFLVVNSSYNSSWRLFINGVKTPLFRANVAFQGFWVPVGEADIVLSFSTPWNYFAHETLIVIFFLVFIYLIVLSKKEHQKESHA